MEELNDCDSEVVASQVVDLSLGGKRQQKSGSSSLFTHPSDAAFTTTHPERG
jgi:hypothetical protein